MIVIFATSLIARTFIQHKYQFNISIWCWKNYYLYFTSLCMHTDFNSFSFSQIIRNFFKTIKYHIVSRKNI